MADKEKTTWHKTTTELLAQYGEAPDDCDECEIKFIDYQIYVLRLCPMHTAAVAFRKVADELSLIRKEYSFAPGDWVFDNEFAKKMDDLCDLAEATLILVKREES